MKGWMWLALWLSLCAATLYAYGCATMEQTCTYENGTLVEQKTESTVVGTGETDFISASCATLAYSTQDTGFSERVPMVVENVTKGAAKGMVEGVIEVIKP